MKHKTSEPIGYWFFKGYNRVVQKPKSPYAWHTGSVQAETFVGLARHSSPKNNIESDTARDMEQ
ncbi:MAG TPA: hypothetical protein DCF33_15995 [Saprospirales bacterium]|nr:hypothetical protein [Saprospirales bacterium]